MNTIAELDDLIKNLLRGMLENVECLNLKNLEMIASLKGRREALWILSSTSDERRAEAARAFLKDRIRQSASLTGTTAIANLGEIAVYEEFSA